MMGNGCRCVGEEVEGKVLTRLPKSGSKQKASGKGTSHTTCAGTLVNSFSLDNCSDQKKLLSQSL